VIKLKKMLIIIFLMAIVLQTCTSALAKGYIHIYLDNTELFLESDPISKNGELCVAFREFVELFEGKVTWYSEDLTAVGETKRTKIVVQNDNKMGKLGTQMVMLDAVPEIINSTLFVPLKFICSGLGIQYTYSETDSSIYLKRLDSVNSYYASSEIAYTDSDGKINLTLNPSASSFAINMNSSTMKNALYFQFSVDEQSDFSAARFVLPVEKVNIMGSLSLYEVIGEWKDSLFGAIDFSGGSNQNGISTASLPKTADTAIAVKNAIAMTSGSSVIELDITDYIKKKIETGKKDIAMYLVYSTWEEKATADGLRVCSVKSEDSKKPRINITISPEPLQLRSGKYTMDVSKSKITQSVRQMVKNGIIISDIKNKANAGTGLNTIMTATENSSYMYYKLNSESVDARSVILAINARAVCNGTLKAYKTVQSSGTFVAEKEPFYTDTVKQSNTYSELQINVKNMIGSDKDGWIKLEFIPDTADVSPCFYIESIDSDNAPYIFTTQRILIENKGE